MQLSSLRSRRSLSVVLGAATLALSASAHAVVNTSVNGAMCQPFGSATGAGLSRSIDGITNTAAAGNTVFCPLTRANASSFGIINVSARVQRAAFDATPINCFIYRMDQFGNFISNSNLTWTGAGGMSLLFGSPASASNFDTMSLLCGLPRVNDKVVSITMSEN